jgi:hypothetical protein
MPAELGTTNFRVSQLSKISMASSFFFSTLFMVFFSVHALQKWSSLLAQVTISLACIFPAIVVLFKVRSDLIGNKKWPIEIKFVLIIVVLGILNICFSENQLASFKGMGLFLMSGILVFSTSYFLLNSKQTQNYFFYLCSFCFVVLLVFGTFEFIQQIHIPGKRILLFSTNPIPAGSLLILLSIGPLVLTKQADNRWKRIFWISCLLAGILLIVLIGQRGPILALIVMVFVRAMVCRKGAWVLILVVLFLVSIGYQLRDNIPLSYKSQLLKIETVLVRIEFIHITLDVVKEKPLFGLGFNSSLSRFIPFDYERKVYPQYNTYNMRVFDNMLFSFLGEMGGLLTLAYTGLFAYVLININLRQNGKTNALTHASLILIVIAGFFINSLTFDSLKYPHLNWLFHSLLGIIARSQGFDQTEK